MSKFELQYASGLLIVVIAITGATDKACYKPPALDYTSTMECCKNTAIRYLEEPMTVCKTSHDNRTSLTDNIDLILMNICEIHCYLNHSGVIENDGEVQKPQLINFLEESIPNAEVKPLLNGISDKCLREVESLKNKEHYRPNCQPYYATLIDCIQGELFTKCPEGPKNTSEMCSASRSYIDYCGINKLRKMFGHNGHHSNDTEDSDNSESRSDYSSEYDYGSDSSSSESEESNSSDSDSDSSGSESDSSGSGENSSESEDYETETNAINESSSVESTTPVNEASS